MNRPQEIILEDNSGLKLKSYRIEPTNHVVDQVYPKTTLRFFGSSTLPIGYVFFNTCPFCRRGSIRLFVLKNFITKSYIPACDVCGSLATGPMDGAFGFKFSFFAADINHPYHEKTLYWEDWQKLSEGKLTKIDESIQSSSLPLFQIDVPIILNKGEMIHYYEESSIAEERAVRKTRSSGSSYRVTKGMYVRMGSSTSESHGAIKKIDHGTLILTSHRLVFSGGFRSYEYPLNKIRILELSPDGISINGGRFQKKHHYALLDGDYWKPYIETAIQVFKTQNKKN